MVSYCLGTVVRKEAGVILQDFLTENETEILAVTADKSAKLAGTRSSSDELKRGLPLFLTQLVAILNAEQAAPSLSAPNVPDMVIAADANNEAALAVADGHPGEAELARVAGRHGAELRRLGYTLSHVVHAYGSMCQAITELATAKNFAIQAREFHDLNRCLDVAIAGAVTEFQSHQDEHVHGNEIKHLGFLAHELRNELNNVKISIYLIRNGTVGFGGSTGKVLDGALKRLDGLITRSLSEVRLRIDPATHLESCNILKLVDQILVTADVEAQSKKQIIEIQVDPDLNIEADRELMHSALNNVIQNAIKYTHVGGTIKVRGRRVETQILIEVEDRCGGLASDNAEMLFTPFEQQHENRKGLGLGLTIARRAIELNGGTIEVQNLKGVGCIFRISMPAAKKKQ